MELINDYEVLSQSGNTGFYQSCEVTQLFIQHKKDKSVENLFILVSFEEKPFTAMDRQYLTKPLAVAKDISVGLQRYWLTTEQTHVAFRKLHDNHKWEIDGDDRLGFGKLTGLAKQFIPANSGNRLSQVLKNNFHNGSYILEFFDESKVHFDFLLQLNKVKILNDLSEQISGIVPINLALVRERLGNVIFQFPITILKASSTRLSNRSGVVVSYQWHSGLSQPKDCIVMVDSKLDGNYLGSVAVPYGGGASQEIITGHVDQITNIKIWSNTPPLLLSVFYGTYLNGLNMETAMVSHEPRIFFIAGEEQKVQISGRPLRAGARDPQDYATYIHSTLYDVDKARLESSLSFKQYFDGASSTVLADLRKLIQMNDKNGVYLWDPYLRFKDILNTLFFSPTGNVPLKAIGAIEKSSKKMLEKKGYTSEHIIQEESEMLNAPGHNNYGLNLEFRMQHGSYGWSFHDRFLIFPGSKRTKPKAYSLGTSVNSIGQSHHILLEVSHPQRVIDAFEELWQKLDHPDCLVWKSIKT